MLLSDLIVFFNLIVPSCAFATMLQQSSGGLLIAALHTSSIDADNSPRWRLATLPSCSPSHLRFLQLEYFPIQVKRMLRRFSYLKAGPSLCP
jgi:hypothetical protein